jgi:hypothetical protein
MGQLERTRPEELPEVLRIAAEYDAEARVHGERVRQRRALCEAAAELGLPREHLERAAIVLRARRIARLRWRRRCGQAARTVLSLALALWLGQVVVQYQAPREEAPTRTVTARRIASPPPTPWPETPPVPAGSFFPVSLSRHVNQSLGKPMLKIRGNDLSELGSGMKRLAGVPFRVEGVVLVGPGETGAPGIPVSMPRRVAGMRIGRKADRLYFLHAAHFVFPQMAGVRIGSYIIHYADGRQVEIPLRAGAEIADWWENGTGVRAATVAWTGSCAAGARVRLFMSDWKNPRPRVTIRSLEMRTGDQPAGLKVPAPFLVGVTAALDPAPGTGGGRRLQAALARPGANLLVNGSFEAPATPMDTTLHPFGLIALSGWRMLRGTVDVVPASYWQPAPGQGGQSLDLAGTPGAATIEQTFTTRPGGDYLFSGWLAHNPDVPGRTEARADVLVSGAPLTQLHHRDARASRTEMRWTRFACHFRATGKRTTLRLAHVGRASDLCGVALDGLTVTQISGQR